jgi:hypothetical protein
VSRGAKASLLDSREELSAKEADRLRAGEARRRLGEDRAGRRQLCPPRPGEQLVPKALADQRIQFPVEGKTTHE